MRSVLVVLTLTAMCVSFVFSQEGSLVGEYYYEDQPDVYYRSGFDEGQKIAYQSKIDDPKIAYQSKFDDPKNAYQSKFNDPKVTYQGNFDDPKIVFQNRLNDQKVSYQSRLGDQKVDKVQYRNKPIKYNIIVAPPNAPRYIMEKPKFSNRFNNPPIIVTTKQHLPTKTTESPSSLYRLIFGDSPTDY